MNIDLLGLKPDDLSRQEMVQYLEDNELKTEAREKIISDILSLDAYHDRLFQVNADLILNGMSFDEVQGVYQDYEIVRDFYYQTGDTFLAQFYENELFKIQLVLDAKDDFKNDQITINEYFKRMSFNLIYDEINMGAENFVISCFENFFKRKPTKKELENGVKMVNGQTSGILLKEGSNKIDFLNIMILNSEFYQGRVLDAYVSLLLRGPSSTELSVLTENFILTDDYKSIQKDLIKTDEYAGFD